MSMKCPDCASTDIHDGYPERMGYWVCVNCGHQWKQRSKKPKFTGSLTLADLVRAAHEANATLEVRLVPLRKRKK